MEEAIKWLRYNKGVNRGYIPGKQGFMDIIMKQFFYGSFSRSCFQ